MVQYYSVLGRQVGSHYVRLLLARRRKPPCETLPAGRDPANAYWKQLAMGVLGTMFGGVFMSLSGGSKTAIPAAPPINASSSDEENFVKCVVYRDEPPNRPGDANPWIGSSWSRRTSLRRRRRRSNGNGGSVSIRELATDVRKLARFPRRRHWHGYMGDCMDRGAAFSAG
ncbi:ATP19 family protein [Candidatus Bathyarchaeota archaeon]|nr:ATP19 family protein [Candidatus Bathyarchaeota archaeon]